MQGSVHGAPAITMSAVRERVGAIKESRCGASIFAARFAYLPQDDNGSLFEYLRG
jgi:hypothetical protein